MPYASNADIPKSVRDALPSSALSIWRSAYNAAAKKGWSEGRCASYAWGAVKAAGFKKGAGDGKWSKSEQEVRDMDVFLSDQVGQKVTVDYAEDAGGTATVRGLPLMHPGVYKGREYTPEYLERIALNFKRQQAEDSFEPPFLPRHSFDSEGKPTGVNISEVLGHFTDIYWDPDAQQLKGDTTVLGDVALEDIKAGRNRYLSTEVDHDYQLDGGEDIGPAIVGVAGVTYPQIRAMPWSLVANSAEFNAKTEIVTIRARGGATMRILETLKEKLGLNMEQASKLEALQAEVSEGLPNDEEAIPVDVLGADPKPCPPKVDLTGMEAQLQQYQKALAEQGQQLQALTAERQLEKAQLTVDEWVRNGLVPPAVRPAAFVLAQAFMADIRQFDVLTATVTGEPQTEKKSTLDMFVDILRAVKPDLPTEPGGLPWKGTDADLLGISEEELDKQAKAEVETFAVAHPEVFGKQTA